MSSKFEKQIIWRKIHTFPDTSSDKKHEISRFLQDFQIYNFQKLLSQFFIRFSLIHQNLVSSFLTGSCVFGPNSIPSLLPDDRFWEKSQPFWPWMIRRNFEQLDAPSRIRADLYLQANKNITERKKVDIRKNSHFQKRCHGFQNWQEMTFLMNLALKMKKSWFYSHGVGLRAFLTDLNDNWWR